jgi:lipopolysaccharide biosynthesis glycosyltransferase
MRDKKPLTNAVVVCCTTNWLPLAAVTLLSCIHQGVASVADQFIICLDATAREREQLNQFNVLNKTSITLVEASAAALPPLETGRFSEAALLRFQLDHLISPNYQQLLYLDCDILAQGPVASIFSENLAGQPLGAVEDYQSLPGPMRLFNDHPRALGLPHGARYFNSGVMLFDWPLALQKNLLAQCRAKVAKFAASATRLSYPDQDVLNL